MNEQGGSSSGSFASNYKSTILRMKQMAQSFNILPTAEAAEPAKSSGFSTGVPPLPHQGRDAQGREVIVEDIVQALHDSKNEYLPRHMTANKEPNTIGERERYLIFKTEDRNDSTTRGQNMPTSYSPMMSERFRAIAEQRQKDAAAVAAAGGSARSTDDLPPLVMHKFKESLDELAGSAKRVEDAKKANKGPPINRHTGRPMAQPDEPQNVTREQPSLSAMNLVGTVEDNIVGEGFMTKLVWSRRNMPWKLLLNQDFVFHNRRRGYAVDFALQNLRTGAYFRCGIDTQKKTTCTVSDPYTSRKLQPFFAFFGLKGYSHSFQFMGDASGKANPRGNPLSFRWVYQAAAGGELTFLRNFGVNQKFTYPFRSSFVFQWQGLPVFQISHSQRVTPHLDVKVGAVYVPANYSLELSFSAVYAWTEAFNILHKDPRTMRLQYHAIYPRSNPEPLRIVRVHVPHVLSTTVSTSDCFSTPVPLMLFYGTQPSAGVKLGAQIEYLPPHMATPGQPPVSFRAGYEVELAKATVKGRIYSTGIIQTSFQAPVVGQLGDFLLSAEYDYNLETMNVGAACALRI